MKVLHESKYTWIGTRLGLHVFVRNEKNFDPEVLLLYRAKMKRKDGSFKYFDPILRNDNSEVNSYHLSMSGKTTDNQNYNIEFEVDDEEVDNSAVCVSEFIRCRV